MTPAASTFLGLTSRSRRAFLQAGSLSALGLSLPHLAAARDARKDTAKREATAKACILLYMLGGPPQQETFDLKPEAPGSARSLFKPIATNVPGIEICELLPGLAPQADRLAIVRSVFHGGNALFHGAGVHYNLTGFANFPREGEPFLDRRDNPSMGSVLTALRKPSNSLPVSVQLPIWITQDGPGREWAGQHAGFLGSRYDPQVMTYDEAKNPPGTLPTGFTMRDDVGHGRLHRRLELRDTLGGSRESRRVYRDWERYEHQALDVLASGTAWNAFKLDDEPAGLREQYGQHTLGRSCLVARRLVEAGVSLVTVVFIGWDTHSNHLADTRDKLLPPLNQAYSALLNDLSDRGLLDSTLVAWTGEFGRTPVINGNSPPGRDHWARVYSTVFAGGGIRGGQVYGQSDKLAGEPLDRPVHVSDFVATMYHALGYDEDTEVVDPFGRPHRVVAGQPVTALF